jgi:hypothetical protein
MDTRVRWALSTVTKSQRAAPQRRLTRAAARAGLTVDRGAAEDLKIVDDPASQMQQLAPLIRKWNLVKYRGGSATVQLQAARKQLKSAILGFPQGPAGAADAAKQKQQQSTPSTVRQPQQPACITTNTTLPSPMSFATPPHVVLSTPTPTAVATAVAASMQRRPHDDLAALHATRLALHDSQGELLAMRSQLDTAWRVVQELQEKAASSAPEAPSHKTRTSSSTPRRSHLTLTLVFEGVPGIAGMPKRDARVAIAAVLTDTLGIHDVSVDAYRIKHVSNLAATRPVVRVQVLDRKLLSSILAAKSAQVMGSRCPISIYVHQQLSARPAAAMAATHKQRQQQRRPSDSVSTPMPKAAPQRSAAQPRKEAASTVEQALPIEQEASTAPHYITDHNTTSSPITPRFLLSPHAITFSPAEMSLDANTPLPLLSLHTPLPSVISRPPPPPPLPAAPPELP